MGGELRVRVAEDRTPPPIEGLDAEDGEWRLSLEAHRDLLVDVTGVEPTDDLPLRDVETMRARLEGYVEREKRARPSDETAAPATEERTATPFQRLVSLLADLLPRVGARADANARAPGERRSEARRSYSVERIRRLAAVFRLAIETRRREIPSASASPSDGTAAVAASSTDAAAD